MMQKKQTFFVSFLVFEALCTCFQMIVKEANIQVFFSLLVRIQKMQKKRTLFLVFEALHVFYSNDAKEANIFVCLFVCLFVLFIVFEALHVFK